MMYAWIRKGKAVNKVVPLVEENWNEFSKNLYLKGYYVTKLPTKPPADRTVRRWAQQGQSRSIGGKWTMGWNNDEDGKPSWLRVLGKTPKKVLTPT